MYRLGLLFVLVKLQRMFVFLGLISRFNPDNRQTLTADSPQVPYVPNGPESVISHTPDRYVLRSRDQAKNSQYEAQANIEKA